MATFYARVWGNGHCDASADAPDELKDVIKSALAQCVRLAPSIDRAAFVERLVARGVRHDVAEGIADTARIAFDDAFFTSTPPH